MIHTDTIHYNNMCNSISNRKCYFLFVYDNALNCDICSGSVAVSNNKTQHLYMLFALIIVTDINISKVSNINYFCKCKTVIPIVEIEMQTIQLK